MSRWFRYYDEALDDPKVQRLPGEMFKAKFLAAVAGEENEFTRFLRQDIGRPTGAEWAVLRAKIFARDDYTCQYCGERGKRLECDHVVPVSRGGSSDEDNLATACFPCNRSKRDKTVEEWLQ